MILDGYIRVSQERGRKGDRFISPTVQREQIGLGPRAPARIEAAGGTFVSVQDGIDISTPTEWELEWVRTNWDRARGRARRLHLPASAARQQRLRAALTPILAGRAVSRMSRGVRCGSPRNPACLVKAMGGAGAGRLPRRAHRHAGGRLSTR